MEILMGVVACLLLLAMIAITIFSFKCAYDALQDFRTYGDGMFILFSISFLIIGLLLAFLLIYPFIA